jgi:hypothetical protein
MRKYGKALGLTSLTVPVFACVPIGIPAQHDTTPLATLESAKCAAALTDHAAWETRHAWQAFRTWWVTVTW